MVKSYSEVSYVSSDVVRQSVVGWQQEISRKVPSVLSPSGGREGA